MGVRLPTTSNHVKSSSKTSTISLPDNHDSPMVAQATLATRADESVNTDPLQVASASRASEATRDGGVSLQTRGAQSARLAAEDFHQIQSRELLLHREPLHSQFMKGSGEYLLPGVPPETQILSRPLPL